jgi:hypothetical protein
LEHLDRRITEAEHADRIIPQPTIHIWVSDIHTWALDVLRGRIVQDVRDAFDRRYRNEDTQSTTEDDILV